MGNKTIKVNKMCKKCGKSFLPREPHQLYCSDICKFPKRFCKCGCGKELKARYGNSKWYPGHSNKKGRWKKCKVCGVDFWVSPSRERLECCTLKCRNVLKKSTTRGANNPAWLGGHTHNRGFGWNKVREKILERDNYKCRIKSKYCDESPRRGLDVHHIVKWNPLRMMELNIDQNLISCCERCHSRIAEPLSIKLMKLGLSEKKIQERFWSTVKGGDVNEFQGRQSPCWEIYRTAD